MSNNPGKDVLYALLNYTKTDAKRWYGKSLADFAALVRRAYGSRNEIVAGGAVTVGTVTASALPVSTTILESVLGGKIKAPIAALTTTDLLTTAGSVGQAIYEDGADASGFSASASETAFATLVLTDSDGAGGATDGDNGAPLLVLVIAGTALTYETQTEHLSSEKIALALASSTAVHDGVTNWAHVAQFAYDEGGGAPVAPVTMNRNNHLGV